RPTPINSRKADITQEMNLTNPKYQRSMSLLKADTTDINMEGNLLDTENNRTNSQEVEESTGEPNIIAIFSNYTDAEEACTHPVAKFENFKPRLIPILSTNKTNYRSVRIWDIPQQFFKKDIATGSIKFDSIKYIQMQTTGPHKSAVVIFTHQLDYDTAINNWSVMIEGMTMKMFPYYHTRKTRLKRDEFSITLIKFSDLITAQDLSNIMQQVSAKACHTSQTNEMFRRFASLNFASHEDLIKATANNIDFKGHKLTCVARIAKLCHYYGNTQYMITNCNIKPLDNSRTRYKTQSVVRFSTYQEETYYSNKNQYRHNKSNRSYAEITQGTNIHHPSNSKLLALIHHIQKTITKVQHQINQLKKSVSILKEYTAYRHMDKMKEDTEFTSNSTIFTIKQLTETKDIKTTQSLINKNSTKCEKR
ncbi:4605_t:CDS:2, partial [Acaulospora morrowiae]